MWERVVGEGEGGGRREIGKLIKMIASDDDRVE